MADREPLNPFLPWARAEAADAVERRIGELWRRAAHAPGLSSRELADVAVRVFAPRVHRPLTLGRYALLLAIGMLAGTGFAVAGHVVRSALETPRALSTAAPATLVTAPRVESHAPSTSLPQPSATASTEEPPRARPSVAVAAPSSSLSRESQLLARALARLKSENDPAGALVALEQYRSEFPAGTLDLEARLARLDALLALDRRAEALGVLELLPLERVGRGAELRVLRAELTLERNPSRALADFDAALAAGLTAALDERALYGRAATRLALGDVAGSTADFETYLTRHPSGRFAGAVRARLAQKR